MTPRRHQRRVGLEVRILIAIALLGLIYAGIGWGLHLLGMSAWAIAVLAAAVLAAQWLGTERLALAATGPARSAPSRHEPCTRRWSGCAP
jgi:hypothetical protein